MDQAVLFALLGLGAGAAYALTGLGIVLIHKGSGVVNFAQGAVAMFSAFVFAQLANAGIEVHLAALLTIFAAAAAGCLVYILVMRPLRNAEGLAQVVASVGLLIALNGTALLLWEDEIVSGALAPSLLPTEQLHAFGASFSEDRLWLVAIVAVLGTALWALYVSTTFGLVTRAVAESERGVALLGFSPDLVAVGNWALGFALAAIAGILVAPITSLSVTALSFMILPALAAALVGRFSNFSATAIAGLLLGVGQSLVTRYVPLQGLNVAVPLIVVVLAVLLQGNRIPIRGTLIRGRPPKAADGRINWMWVVLGPALAIFGLLSFSGEYKLAITTSLSSALVAMSLVVVTGYVGQANLAPLSFAAAGAFGVSALSHNLGIPFPLPIIIAALVTVPLGIVIGLPALRIRGMNLAVVTLGIGIAMDAMVFQNYAVSGGETGRRVNEPTLFGFSLDNQLHPARYGIFVLTVVVAVALLLSSMRQGSLGRRMLAVRRNERAAAMAGVNVAGVKLGAFGLSSFIAALAGGLNAYEFGATSADNFSTMLSLLAVAVAFVGGIASVSGAFTAGLMASGGLVYVLLNEIGGISSYWQVITGVLLILTVVTQPDGVALKNIEIKAALMTRLRRGAGRPRRTRKPIQSDHLPRRPADPQLGKASRT